MPGSDAGATRTKAVLDDGDEWVVNGSKAFITNSGTDITSVVTVTARTGTDDDGSARDLARSWSRPAHRGSPSSRAYDKLGWNISDTHGLSFAGCRVPEDHLLGERGNGFRQFLKTLDDGRIAISALAARPDHPDARGGHGLREDPHGVRQADRRQPGRRLPDRRPRRHGGDRAPAHLPGRLAQGRAGAGRRSVAEVKQAAAIAKLYTSEAAVTATRIATQVFGGNGFMEEYPVARFYRDAKILEIGEGTSEVQRMVIARNLGLPTA